MNISFDFDDTLSKPSVQEYAKKLIDAGHRVVITTSRYEDVSRYWFDANHNDLFSVADALGITEIRFTNIVYKYYFLSDFDIHIDDDSSELETIQRYTDCKAIQVKKSGWKKKVDRIINDLI